MENTKTIILDLIIRTYSDEELSELINNNSEMTSIINSIILLDFNNNFDGVTKSVKGDAIEYTIGGDYQLMKLEILSKVFLQLSDKALLDILLKVIEKLNTK